MKPPDAETRRKLNGYLPFYSVDTREEADALVALAIEAGEFVQGPNGEIIEVTLAYEQTLENLNLAGDRLAALHDQIRTGE